ASGVTESRPKSGFYDFDAKYTEGMTDHICPAEIPDEITEACKNMASRAHVSLGCKGTSRSDFRWDDEQPGSSGLFSSEVNTQPGMTPLSLVPEQARHVGMSYADSVEAIVADASGSTATQGLTIRRSGKGVRRAAAAKGAQRKVATAKKQTGNVIDGVMQWSPFSEETSHRIVSAVILGVAAMLVWVVASMAGVPMSAQEKSAQVASGAGFEVKRVEVRGVNRMNESKIYEKVSGQRDQSMPRLDIDGLRGDSMQLSWVKDARVSRQLPDTSVVDIVERSPHAVSRKGGKSVSIDDTGHELEPVSAARAKGMSVSEGEGAGEKVQDLGRSLDVAPASKPQVAEAEWI
ncbi:hypothetical protein OY671_007932, partial [Metschnikowia pulcherrima]